MCFEWQFLFLGAVFWVHLIFSEEEIVCKQMWNLCYAPNFSQYSNAFGRVCLLKTSIQGEGTFTCPRSQPQVRSWVLSPRRLTLQAKSLATKLSNYLCWNKLRKVNYFRPCHCDRTWCAHAIQGRPNPRMPCPLSGFPADSGLWHNHTCDYVTLCGKRDFSDVTKIFTNWLTLS